MNDLSIDQSQNIPLELWTSIASYFSGYDLISFSLVSRIFHNISNEQSIWKELTRRNYPDTFVQLTKRRIVQKTKKGRKKRRIGFSEEINWKQQWIESVHLFSAKKSRQFQNRTLLENVMSCFDIFERTVYIGVRNKSIVPNSPRQLFPSRINDKLVSIMSNHDINIIKVERRKDGDIYLYTGAKTGRVMGWKFCETHFERKMKAKEPRQPAEIFGLDIHRNFVISVDCQEVCFVNKKTGALSQRFSSASDTNSGSFTSSTLAKNKIFVGTFSGNIKIWDPNSHEQLLTIENTDRIMHLIDKIKVYKEKIFYSTPTGIYTVSLDQEEKTAKEIMDREDITCFQGLPFDVFENRLFIQDSLETPQGIKILVINAETLTVESEILSISKLHNTQMKLIPHGILQSGLAMSGKDELRVLQPQ